MRETRLVASKLEDCVNNDASDAADAAAALGETMGASCVAALVVAFALVKIGGGVALKAHRPHR